MKQISKSIILLAGFAIATAVVWQGSVFQTADAWNSEEESTSGSITICKIIVDAEGTISTGSNSSSTTFSIAGIDFDGNDSVPSATGVLPTASFAIPLILNANILGNDNVSDASCTAHENLPFGSYYYSQELISNAEQWNTPLYNDQHTANISTQDDFFSYSGELFTENNVDDSSRNTNADGHITLSISRPERTLVVLNRMTQLEDLKECSDLLDNDNDGKIDAADPACHTDGNSNNQDSYDSNDNDENSKPVITLIGSETISITEGDSFTDPSATADDQEDGNITNNIVKVSNVNTSTHGSYSITYNVTDSLGAAADQIARAITVNQRQNTGGGGGGSGGGGSGGGGGGGRGGSKIFLEITNEAITLNETGAAVVTWNTNLQATSMVVYDVIPHGTSTVPALSTDYAFTTSTSTALVTSHSMSVYGLLAGRTYYFRPYSERSDDSELGIELTITPTSTTAIIVGEGGTAPLITNTAITRTSCREYLTSYIKLGAQNNPDDVRKLELYLNTFEGFNLPVDGIYEQHDYDAVVIFQERYFDDILAPWGHTEGTGYVYYTTHKKINETYCRYTFPLSEAQLAEIAEFKALLERLRQSGGSLEDIDFGSTVGVGTMEEKTADAKTDFALKDLQFGRQNGNDADKTSLTARLYDALKDRLRMVGLVLIALAVLILGISIIRSRYPPLT